MLTAEENVPLTRVEGDAPMGRMVRRHWMPAALSEQLAETDAWRRFGVAEVGVDLDADFRPALRHARDNHLQDRAAMKQGSSTGLPGIPNQDMAMWEGMGAIADRTSGRLGASDIALVQFRRLMLDAVARHQAGADPIGLSEPRLPQAKLRSHQGLVPKTEDWRTLGASDEERVVLAGLEEDETEREMAQAAAE